MKLFHTGSESHIFLHENLIFKYRVPKKYRIPILDEKIRLKRTEKEKKIIKKLKSSGVNCPEIFEFLPEYKKILENEIKKDEKIIKSTIIMNFINGKTLNEILNSKFDQKILEKFGQLVQKIHSSGIIHGDLTPANIILKENDLFVIDFGLSFFSNKLEDRAVDIRLIEKTLFSLFSIDKIKFDLFLEKYTEKMNEEEKQIFLDRLESVRARGRKIGC